MLQNWQSHSDYQQQPTAFSLYSEKRSRLLEPDKAISKLYHLNLYNLLPILKPYTLAQAAPLKISRA